MDIEKRLEAPSPEVRRRALLDLGPPWNTSSADHVLHALSDEDWRVRKEAVGIARQMAGDDRVLLRLIDLLVQEEDIGARNAVVEVLVGAGPHAVEVLMERFPSLRPGGRKIAIEVFGGAGAEAALDLLVNALHDPDHAVRICAAEWLGEFSEERSILALRGCLDSADKMLVLAALQSLDRQSAAVPWYEVESIAHQALFGGDLLMVLGRSGDPRAAPVIAQKLGDELAAARALEILHGASSAAAAAVQEALGKLEPSLLSRLAMEAIDFEPKDRHAAVACVLWSRSETQIDTIIELAQRESLYPLLLSELGQWGKPVLDVLSEKLSTLSGRPLASALGLLARLWPADIGDEERHVLAFHLASCDAVVATAAAGALSRFGDSKVVDRLALLLRSDNERLSKTAGHALKDIGRKYPKEVHEALAAVELEGRAGVALCQVLEVVGGPQDAPRLTAALSSPSPELRRAVVATLPSLGGAESISILALAMTDEDLGVRMAAAASLSKLGPAAAETLVSALHGTTGPLKAALVRGLGKVGHADAPRILKSLLRDSTEVALAALEAALALGVRFEEVADQILSHGDPEVIKQSLAALGDSLSGSQLGRLLSHANWDVRLAAVDGLGRLPDKDVEKLLSERLDLERDDLVIAALNKALETRRGRRES
jgi:HEAT repeat protein